MKRINLFAGSAILSLTLLVGAACSANRNADGSSSTPNANAGTLARTDNADQPTPPATLAPVNGEASPTPKSQEDEIPRANAADAKRLVEAKQAVLIDVRSADAYKSSHAQGALHVDVTEIEAGKHKSLPRDKELITYCT